MRLFGDDPVIGYRHWTVNDDNFINLNYKTRLLDAKLSLESDSSNLVLLTNRIPGEGNEEIMLYVDNLKLEEWTQIVPMLDGTSGTVNADIEITWDGVNADGDGTIDIKDFVYNGKPEGDVTLTANFDLDPATVRRQFTNQQGDIYKTYLQGRLQKELEIRQAVLTSALNGSSPAQLQMLQFFAAADEENKTL